MATFYRNYLLGMVAEEARQVQAARAGTPRPALALGIELSHLGDGARDYPNLRCTARMLATIEPEASFRTGLKIPLDGMRCHIAELASSKKAQPAG